MATITLGKVKFMYRGTYDASTTYSKGDIVDHDNRKFIFVNDTPKAHAPVLLQTLNGNISSLVFKPVKLELLLLDLIQVVKLLEL